MYCYIFLTYLMILLIFNWIIFIAHLTFDLVALVSNSVGLFKIIVTIKNIVLTLNCLKMHFVKWYSRNIAIIRTRKTTPSKKRNPDRQIRKTKCWRTHGRQQVYRAWLDRQIVFSSEILKKKQDLNDIVNVHFRVHV